MKLRFIYPLLFLAYFKSIAQAPENIDLEHSGYTIRTTNAEKTDFYPYFYNQHKVDSINKHYSNSHKRSLALEEFLIEQTATKILIEGKSRVICAKNGKEYSLSPTPNTEEVAYTFEKEFTHLNIFVFRVQWFEGNNYFLFNANTGQKIYCIGRPVINGNKIICINDDIEAQYSYNGFQLIEIKNDVLVELWKFKTKWAPKQIKWIDEGILALKGYTISGSPYAYEWFFKNLEIKEKPLEELTAIERNLLRIKEESIQVTIENVDFEDLFIADTTSIVFTSPNEKEIEKMKQEYGEETFYASADDMNFYSYDAQQFLKSRSMTFVHTDKRFLRFLMKNRDTIYVDTNKLENKWSIVLNDGYDKPYSSSLLDIKMNFEELDE